MAEESTITAEISDGLRLSGGKVWTFTLIADRKPRAHGGLTKGRKVGSIVADTLPELLRSVASLAEHQEEPTLEFLVKRLEGVPKTIEVKLEGAKGE